MGFGGGSVPRIPTPPPPPRPLDTTSEDAERAAERDAEFRSRRRGRQSLRIKPDNPNTTGLSIP